MWATCFTRSILLLVLVRSRTVQNHPVCGIPGVPFGGHYSPLKLKFEFEEEIRYSCPEGVVKGDKTRSCLQNGLWSGSVPVCLQRSQGTNVSLTVRGVEGRKLLAEGLLWTQPDRRECTSRYNCKDLKIRVRFNYGNYSLDGFELTFPMPSFPKFVAFSEHPEKTRTLCNISDTTHADDGLMTTVRLDCYSLKPSSAIFFEFQPDKDDELLSLCHFSLLFHPKAFSCGLPDAPLNGYVEQKSNETRKWFDFNCFTDFEIKGVPSTDCASNGTWSNSSPTCVRKVDWESLPTTTSPISSHRYNLNYVYIGLGCLGFIIVLVTVICLVVKSKKQRGSQTTSNGTDSSSRGEASPNTYHNQPGFGIPNHVHFPYPLPRGVHLQAERQSSANPNHYSVVHEPGSSGNPLYLSILGDLPGDKNNSDHIYADCFSGELYADCTSEELYADCVSGELYADCIVPFRQCPTVPQPPNTRFSVLGTFARRLPRGGN